VEVKIHSPICLHCVQKEKFTFTFNSLNLVVTSGTTTLNVKRFYVLPIECFFLVFRSVFTWNSDLHSIKWSLFTTEMKYVYCAVRTESLNIIQVNFRLQTLIGRWKTYYTCVCVVTLHHILVLWGQIKRSLKSLFTGHRESRQTGISFSLSSYVTILVLYVMPFNRKSLYSYFSSMAMV